MRKMVGDNVVPTCDDCNGLVKPDIVFFGESLPERFHESIMVDFERCHMLIVMGTSLQVQPFASLVNMVQDNCPVLLINMENSAPWKFKAYSTKDEFEGSNKKAFWKGDCDQGCTKLESFMGWEASKNANQKTTDDKKSNSASL